MTSIYEKFANERKELQAKGEVPGWYTTGGYQMFMLKYAEPGQSLKDRYKKIAKTAGDIATELYGWNDWENTFFDLIWKGWLSPSTPVLANLGTTRGLPVSCTGNYVVDSIYGFYSSRLESAVLTKHGFGTSSYLGDIRPRGSKFSDNGKAAGPMPVIKGFVQDMDDTSQGSTRRGAWAGYIEADHADFDEIVTYLRNNPDGLNVGWNITDDFINKLKAGDQEAVRRYKAILKTRAITGKGYMFFVDKVNRLNPESYAKNGLSVKASNLCSEITLHSDADHSFTCVLSSMNLAHYDDWEDTSAVKDATVFLDCVAEAFVRAAKGIKGTENAVRFTEKSRALGLGVMGYHTYLQDNMIPFDSEDAYIFNKEAFNHIRREAEIASTAMADLAGAPEWADGRRNTHLMAIAPTMSTALLVGGVSQGIEPIVANAWNQSSAAGEIFRVNPTLLKIMKERNVYTPEIVDHIIDNNGSVQDVDWLTGHEKDVFKTAYEIDQVHVVQQASDRQQYIDQGQSLNLFFDAKESPAKISDVHKQAMLDPYVKALYYFRSKAGVQASKARRKEN